MTRSAKWHLLPVLISYSLLEPSWGFFKSLVATPKPKSKATQGVLARPAAFTSELPGASTARGSRGVCWSSRGNPESREKNSKGSYFFLLTFLYQASLTVGGDLAIFLGLFFCKSGCRQREKEGLCEEGRLPLCYWRSQDLPGNRLQLRSTPPLQAVTATTYSLSCSQSRNASSIRAGESVRQAKTTPSRVSPPCAAVNCHLDSANR